MLYSFTNILLYFVYISHMFLQFEYVVPWYSMADHNLASCKQKCKENSLSVVFLYTVSIQFFPNCML